MNLELPDWLPSPMWAKLEQMMDLKVGKSLRRKVGHVVRTSAVALKTYFTEVLNPIIRRDFRETRKIVFHDCKLEQG